MIKCKKLSPDAPLGMDSTENNPSHPSMVAGAAQITTDHITHQHIVVDDEDGAGCVHAASSGLVAMRAVKVAADRPNSTTVTASQCRRNG